MKQIFTFIFSLFLLGTIVKAQTTAVDWSKSDCIGSSSVNLYATLDAGNVIVQEYVMMNCSPCVTAANGLKSVVNSFAASYPGKVKIFQTSYNNSTSCTDMIDWASAGNISNTTLFISGASEISYYGGMGMPTIVVLGGGTQHKVFYKKQGYSANDNANNE